MDKHAAIVARHNSRHVGVLGDDAEPVRYFGLAVDNRLHRGAGYIVKPLPTNEKNNWDE